MTFDFGAAPAYYWVWKQTGATGFDRHPNSNLVRGSTTETNALEMTLWLTNRCSGRGFNSHCLQYRVV